MCQCNILTNECYCGILCWYCGKENSGPTYDTRGRCFGCNMSFNCADEFKKTMLEGVPKEKLMDMIVEMANVIHRKTKHIKNYYIPIDLNELEKPEYFQLTPLSASEFIPYGDCIPQCLNCARQGKDGFGRFGIAGSNIGKCTCENPQWSACYSDIQKAKKEGGHV